MKKLHLVLSFLLVCLFNSKASAQFLTVTTPSSCITDGSGAVIASGTMIVVGTDANDNPIPYRAGTSIMSTSAPISRTITSGALATSLQLADPLSTSPLNVLYRFAIQDNLTKKITLYKQIVISNNDSGNFNFCKMNPLPFTTQVQFASAPFSFSSDWALLGNLSVAKSTELCSSTVAFSATPTFNAGNCNGFKITLTGNVTSSTLTGATLGEPLYFEICQDGTGGRTFVPPSNVLQWTTIQATPSTCSVQLFWFDGTNAYHDLVSTNSVNGVNFPSNPSNHTIPVVTATNTIGYKAISDCTNTTGNHLNYTQSTDSFSCGTSVPLSVTESTITQPASTLFSIVDNQAGTRYSIPSGGSAQATLNNTAIGGGSSFTGTSNRIRASGGNSVVTGDFVLSGSWGNTATKSAIFGTDAAGSISVTANGIGIAANPTITFTFHDGAWSSQAICALTRNDGSGVTLGSGAVVGGTTSTTVAVISLFATATAGNTYIFTWLCN